MALLLCAALDTAVRADEIRLKDGNKLYGVIVAYEDNMFKVRTPFGYVLVEKDKIADIVPSTIGSVDSKEDNKAAATAKHPAPAKPAAKPPAEAVTPADASADSGTAVTVSEKTPDPAVVRREKTSAILANSAVKPEVPAVSTKKVVAPALRPVATTDTPAANGLANAAPPAPPVEAAPEEIRGNLYINHANSFRIYKAPSWNLIEDARSALPNAVMAMGTSNESTLLVVGKEKSKQPLEPAAAAVEHRVREVYENYRQISRRLTTVGGLPGIEFRYRGMADEHDWSGTLVVVTRGDEIFTILGMTYADTDLIQIQENVIARAIASLDFSASNAAPAK
ncbi:MAG: hypothetical protein ABSG69_16430 [Candidatus Acidiferrum sp.]